jgi:hypothetical protein
VDDIDPWIGVISEYHAYGMAVGQLADAILTDQFTRLRNGDRFWYKNDSSISDNDRALIDSTTLSALLSRNTAFTFNNDVFHV